MSDTETLIAELRAALDRDFVLSLDDGERALAALEVSEAALRNCEAVLESWDAEGLRAQLAVSEQKRREAEAYLAVMQAELNRAGTR